MLHALVTLMIDSFALSYYKKHGFHKKGGGGNGDQKAKNGEKELGRVENGGAHVGHCHRFNGGANDKDSILLRNRALAQAGYGMKIKAILAFFFSATTPLGIVLEIAIRYVSDPLDASHPYLALILDMKLLSRHDNLGSSIVTGRRPPMC
ncbi:hypothetical protein D5086_016395 [Populus alba]|uniref:Uncharacterized protein n=1 Tax=Populus alba TaxID=43335 RepID=A0ACC4BWM0_POPAL